MNIIVLSNKQICLGLENVTDRGPTKYSFGMLMVFYL